MTIRPYLSPYSPLPCNLSPAPYPQGVTLYQVPLHSTTLWPLQAAVNGITKGTTFGSRLRPKDDGRVVTRL